MSTDTLNEFLLELDRAGELVRVKHPVSVNLEMCEIADRVMKQPGGGKALLFERPILMDGTPSAYPVAINTFGSMRRMAMSLGVEKLDEVGDRITELLQMKVPEGLIGKLSLLPRLLEVGKFPPRMRRGDAPCHEVVWRGDEVNLDKLPLMKCWPEDGGAYITVPMVITRDPKRGIRNVGMYRIMQTGKTTLAMHWQRHKVGAAHWREMAERGEKMPVCIALGADPPSMYSASAPLPPTIDEFLFAGFLQHAGLNMTKVPYRNPVEAANDLAEGRVQAYLSALAIVRPQIEAGKIKPLAVTNKVRAPTAPDVPTVKEAGYPDLTLDGLVGFFGPPEMSNALRERIAAWA